MRVLIGSRVPRAFTLIELLVVIAVIGILIGLLLPAVQSARETGRRAKCSNNLRQIGIALQAYHDKYDRLPVGCLEWRSFRSPPTHRQFAWSAMILPELDQANLHAQINFGVPFDHPLNAEVALTKLAIYSCPSAPLRKTVRAKTDYGGIYGQRINTRRPDNGVFLYERSIRFADIRDGLTNTLAVAEDTGSPDAEWINGRNVFVQAHGVNDDEAWEGDNEIRSMHPAGALALYCGGRVTFLSNQTEKQLLAAIITRNGHEPVEAP